MDYSTNIYRLRRARKPTQASLRVVAAGRLAPTVANDDWPALGRNVRPIVPSMGESDTGDTIGRLFAKELSKRLKLAVVVDHRSAKIERWGRIVRDGRIEVK